MDHDEINANFMSLTNTSPVEAEFYLGAANYDLDRAVQMYYGPSCLELHSWPFQLPLVAVWLDKHLCLLLQNNSLLVNTRMQLCSIVSLLCLQQVLLQPHSQLLGADASGKACYTSCSVSQLHL